MENPTAPTTATNLIKVTKDYSKFKTLTSNRTVDENHVKRLKKSMTENPHLFEARPILVNQNMFVIDGQHRLKAAKEAGMPIYYMISDGITVEDTRLLNTTQRNWSLMDFARSFASTGNENYKTYLSVVAKYPGIPSTVIRYYLGGNKSQSHNEVSAFKSGDYTIERPNLAGVYLDQLDDIHHKLPEVAMNRSLSLAFFQLFDSVEFFDYDYFLSKLDIEGARSLMRSPLTIKEGLRCIEDAYNFNRSEKNRVRFY